MSTKSITVFTPTYNRAGLLKRCYQSLTGQTVRDFVWLIVDDGSTDETAALVHAWISENRIEIRYVYQANAGKYRAHNAGVALCDTELFFCMDSDDYLRSDAVETVVDLWETIRSDRRLAGIVALRGYDLQHVNGTWMPEGIHRSSLFDLYEKYGFKGDTALIFRTEVLRKHMFPVYEDEKFLTEAYIYDQIDQVYQLHLFNRIIYLGDYLPDGLSHRLAAIEKGSPRGQKAFLYSRVRMYKNPVHRYRARCLYVKWCLTTRQELDPETVGERLLDILTLPGVLYMVCKQFLKGAAADNA